MATPQMRGPIVLKATLGRGHSLREEETTVGEDGEDDREDERSDSDVTEPPATFKPNPSRGNMKTSITGRTRVPKRAEVIVSTEPREVPCDRCLTKGGECLPRIKGGQALEACLGCFRQKLSCRTGGAGRRKKAAEEKDANDEGSDGSGKQWMLKFSTMKVGPPKAAKPARDSTDMGERHLRTVGKVASPRRQIRTAGVEAKQRLERYCEWSNHRVYSS